MNAPPPTPLDLPRLRLVLAVSLDGRLAPPEGGAAQIGGRGDRRVLEEALAWADAALLGAETLRRHGSTCLIHAPELLARRRQRGRPDQPLALVASRSGRISGDLPFFRQPLARWLLLGQGTGQAPVIGASQALSPSVPDAAASRGLPVDKPATAAVMPPPSPPRQTEATPPGGAGRAEALPAGFARVLPLAGWTPTLRQLAAEGLERLVVLGGAALAADLLLENRIDELQLTLCPQLLGGTHTWLGCAAAVPLHVRHGWRLLEQRRLEGEELLLRYCRDPACL